MKHNKVENIITTNNIADAKYTNAVAIIDQTLKDDWSPYQHPN